MKNKNIQIWEKPVKKYEEDGGRHPTPEQTKEILQYINEKAQTEFGIPYMLNSATKEIITSDRFYAGVNSLYKYGCSGCSSKVQNKWWNLCSECTKKSQDDEVIQEALVQFNTKLDEIKDAMHPTLENMRMENNSDSESNLQCDDCNIHFENGNDIREHFKEKHPNIETIDIRDKAKYSDKNNETKKISLKWNESSVFTSRNNEIQIPTIENQFLDKNR